MALTGNVNPSTGSYAGWKPPATTAGYAPPPRPAEDRAPMENSKWAAPGGVGIPVDPLPPGYLDALKAYYGAGLGDLDKSLNLANANGAYRANYLSGQEGFANAGYANDVAQLGLKRADLGIDQRTGQSLLANLQQALNLNNQGLTDTLANIDRRLGTDTLSQNYDWRDKIQALSSARIAGGFGMAPGYNIGAQQINESNANQLQALQNAALYARQQASNENAKSNLGVNNSIIRQQGELSHLDNAFQGLGLQGDALKIALDQKLADIGLSKFTNSQELEKMANSTDAQKRALFAQLASQLAPYMGYSPQATQGLG